MQACPMHRCCSEGLKARYMWKERTMRRVCGGREDCVGKHCFEKVRQSSLEVTWSNFTVGPPGPAVEPVTWVEPSRFIPDVSATPRGGLHDGIKKGVGCNLAASQGTCPSSAARLQYDFQVDGTCYTHSSLYHLLHQRRHVV